VRGDLKAVVRAILLDPEARNAPVLADAKIGKVREPVLRVSAFFRAFDAKSATTRFQIGNTDDPSTSLGQTPMRSPSVFNYYRPGYAPPNSELAAASLVAPELQLANETSVAGYLNTMMNVVQNGYGSGLNNQPDVKADYTYAMSIAHGPDVLLDHLSLMLTSGQLTSASRQRIRDVVNSITISQSSASAATTARRNRVLAAVYLTIASPEFIAQK
jgi:hypothetical protein